MAHCEAMAHLQNYQEATNFLGTCHQTLYRMINSKRKEVYIPIEIKPREFISQLLLGAELAKIGFRVYLGTKKAIDELVENKNNKQGVYLYKGGGGTINKFKKLSKLVESIAVLDQEISPNVIDSGVIIKNRFVKGCLKYVSRLYYVGPEARKKAIEVLEDIDHPHKRLRLA